MQPHSSTSQAGTASERPNEFTEAVARMFSNRPKMAFAESRLPMDDPPERESSSWSLRSVVMPRDDLRRAILIAPLAVVGFVAFWFFLQPSQPSPSVPSPSPVRNVIEAKAEARVAADPVPAALREEIVEAKAPAQPRPEPVAPPPQPTIRELLAEPLNRDEIKEMQGKLGTMGFGPGPVDGVVGPQTQAALKRYAQSRNLAKSEATQEVLSRLRAEP